MITEGKKFRFNPKSKSFLRDPYPIYHEMRQNQPYYRLANTLILTRYDDVYQALRSPHLVTSGIPASLRDEFNKHLIPLDKDSITILTNMLLFQDGEPHHRHRKSMMALFNGDNLNQLNALIQQEINALISTIGNEVQTDIIANMAHPLWFGVFSAWLDLTTEETQTLYQQSEKIRLLLDPSAITKDGLHHLIQALNILNRLFSQNYAENKSSNTPSVFYRAVTAGDADYSAMDYIIDAMTVFIGGGETTGALVGNALYFLATLPHIQNAARLKPALIRTIVQETMRLESPLQMTRRWVVSPLAIGGVELKSGDNVLLCLGAANRDDRQFAEPQTFSLERKNGGKQLGFGVGMHQCLGQLLAQRQAELVCASLLNTFPALRHLEAPPPQWQESSLILRALSGLPLSLY